MNGSCCFAPAGRGRKRCRGSLVDLVFAWLVVKFYQLFNGTIMDVQVQLGIPGAESVQAMSVDELRTLVELVCAHGVTRRFIAESAGYSGSALSSWMKGTYGRGGDDRSFEVALRSALERILRKRFFTGNRISGKFPRLVTSVARSIFTAARACHLQGLMGLVTGPAGRGKTTASEMYAASNSGVVYVPSSPFMTRKQLMAAIARPLEVEAKSSYELLLGICERLSKQRSLVIVDEAEHLSLDLLDAVRQIHDWSGAGLLFIGLEQFYAMLARARRSHEYLVDRFTLRMGVRDLVASDVELLVKTEFPAVQGLVPEFLKACGGSARLLETLTFHVRELVEAGEELCPRIIHDTAESVRIF
jgi:DNA transposition AAA+ family ATPase